MGDPAMFGTLAVVWLLSLAAAGWLARRGQVSADLHRDLTARLLAGDAQAEALRQTAGQATLKYELEAQRAARLETVELSREAVRSQLAMVQTELGTTRAIADQERLHAAENLALLQDTRAKMTLEFQQLAHGITAQHGETFKLQNKEQVEALLHPLRENIGEFQKWLATTHTETVKDRAGLGAQIKVLLEQGTTMTDETAKLTRALKGDVRQQGAWGEMILDTILERSGLVHGEHFTRQESVTSEDGLRLRPDVVVHVLSDQRMVIDSKVSLKAFEGFVNAEDDATRTAQLGQHHQSIRKHIDTLSAKQYATATGSRLGFVVMFVPIEGALAAAMQADPDLANYAADRHVGIATPVTLLMVLKTIHTVWKSEQRNTNAEEIAKRAGQLYDKFRGFTDDMLKIGNGLEGARAAYDTAMGKLSTGNGNLVGQAQKLKELGARAGKSVAPALLTAAGFEEGETAVDERSPASSRL